MLIACRLSLLFALTALPLAACGPAPAREAGDLLLAAGRAAGEDWVFAESSTREKLEPLLRSRFQVTSNGSELRVLGAQDSGAADRPRIVVGSMSSPVLRPHLVQLGLDGLDATTGDSNSSGAQTLQYLGRLVDPQRDILLAVFEDPERPGFPLTVIAGEQERLAPQMHRLCAGSKPACLVIRNGRVVLEVQLRLSGRARSSTLIETKPRWARDPGAYRGQSPAILGISLQVDRELPPLAIESYLMRLAAARERIATWLPAWQQTERGFGPTLSLEAHVHRTRADRDSYPLAEWIRPVIAGAGVARGERVRALVAARPSATGRRLDDGGATWLRAALQHALGDAAQAWMCEAAAVDATDSWYGWELGAWCAHLTRAACRPPLEALLAADADTKLSRHIVVPLRAMVFRTLRKAAMESGRVSSGPGGLAQLWVDASALPELESLERWWLDEIKEAVEQHSRGEDRRGRIQGARGARMGVAVGATEAGLGSVAIEAALMSLREAGADMVCFDAFVTADAAEMGSPWQANAKVEVMGGDAPLAASIAQARRLGMRVAVVAHLLPTSQGTFDADLKKTNSAEWAAFFESYEHMISHVALLAELAEADLLLLGAGHTEAMRTQEPKDGEEGAEQALSRKVKAEAWSRIIDRSRSAFLGGLSVAADDSRAAEAIGFWTELDYVGISFQPGAGSPDGFGPGRVGPVDGRKTASRMVGQMKTMHQLAQAHGRPLLIAGAGFRATSGAWRGRYGGADGDASRAEQTRLLLAFAGALARLPDEDALPAGLWLDRWDSAAAGERSGERGLDLSGSPAAAALGRIFKRD
ncbi:MAG: hypothetical protein ACI835_001224 [Planctomycetota bacterium]